MPNLDIQKVPGVFNTPQEGWPRLQKIDIAAGLIHEWDALSLPLGELPAQVWAPSKGLKDLEVQAGPNLTVVEDVNGIKGVKFEASRLGTTVDIKGETTFLIALRPSGITPTGALRLFSGDANLFRGLYLESRGFSATVGANKTTPPATLVGPRPLAGGATVVAIRYGAELDGKVLGNPISPKTITAGMPDQVKFLTGSNGSIPAQFLYDGLVYRYQIWNRLLSDAELDAAIYDNTLRYKIS